MQPASAISDADFEVMQSLARALRHHVDALPDGSEIVGTVRAEIEPLPHPPEPPARQGKLTAAILELLQAPDLSPEQSLALRASFFGAD
jgi:hypothetical protein